MSDSPPHSSTPARKPWPMGWIVAAIVLFVGLYTFVSVQYRKQDPAHLPYEAARHRGGHALREAGWEPFPNAYGLPGDDSSAAEFPVPIEEVAFEKLPRDHPRVRAWSDRLPPLEQGEQVASVAAASRVPPGRPYVARISWEVPEEFRAPQLIAFRRERSILIVPRAPERFSGGTSDSTIFIVPPEFLEPGLYEVLLSTEGAVNRWTFNVE